MGTLSGVWVEKPFSAYRGDGPYVFVCYAHEDSEAVFREIAWLNDYGVNVWYDEGISPGHEWREELAAAIQGCSRMLFFVSPRSVVSEHCRRELNFAQEENREVIAIHLEPTEMPAGLRLGLNNRQAIIKHELSDEEFHKRLMRAAQGSGSPATASPSTFVAKAPRRKSGVVLTALALVAFAAGAWWLLTRGVGPEDIDAASLTESEPALTPKVSHNSIAVLPFDNLSPDPNNAYFAAGIHEEILNQLAKIRDLSVIARTTMLRYVDSDKTVPEIGRELNVGTVMEGSVRYAGSRVRITTQLIDTKSGAHLWSQAYEEELQDIFGIQLAIATRVADSLQSELTAGERAHIAARTTNDPQALANYLKALASWGNLGAPEPTLESLNAAIAIDPKFAKALAFKAAILVFTAAYPEFFSPNMDEDKQTRLIESAERSAIQALDLDDRQNRAHMAMGFVHAYYREWDKARAASERAFELGPNDYFTASQDVVFALIDGDLELAKQRAEHVARLNPADAASIWSLGDQFYGSRDWAIAEEYAELVCSLLPESALGYALLAKTQARLDKPQSARLSAMAAEARNPGPRQLLDIANAYALIGDLKQTNRIYAVAGGGDESRMPNLGLQFRFHMAIQDYDSALAYLERAVQGNLPFSTAFLLYNHRIDVEFDPLLDRHEFKELLRRVSVPLR